MTTASASHLTPVPVPPTSANAPATPADPSQDWKTVYPPEAWKRIRVEGIFLASVLIFGVIVSIVLLTVPFAQHDNLQRIMCCALGGIAGSWIYSMKWFARVVLKGIWRYDLIAWRFATPFMGIFLAVSAYAMLQTGLLGITFVAPSPNNANYNPDPKLFAYGVGFMVGLFSDVVMGKLTEVAETLFGRSQVKTKS